MAKTNANGRGWLRCFLIKKRKREGEGNEDFMSRSAKALAEIQASAKLAPVASSHAQARFQIFNLSLWEVGR
jgi:hypothetical protein